MTNGLDLSNIEVGYPGTVSGANLPKRISQNASVLCSAEWSWSPAHCRSDQYLLHSGRHDWFLWLSYYDDYFGRIEKNVIGRMPKNGVAADAAAKALLSAFWTFDCNECEVDRPHDCEPAALPEDVLQELMDQVWGTKSVISKDLIKAYESTDFHVLEPRIFILKIGQGSPEVADLYSQMGVSSAGFITAWNPFSEEKSSDQNRRSQAELQRTLSLEGLPTLNAIGVDPSGEWPSEESFLILGLSLERAKVLGTDFSQNAIVWIGADATPKLVLLR